MGSEVISKEKFIKDFIDVMMAHERYLSDGYNWYCGRGAGYDDNGVETELTEAAEELWEKMNEQIQTSID